MASLNKKAKQVVEKYDVSACTDVTGFGLLGHSVEMASASDVTFDIRVKDVAIWRTPLPALRWAGSRGAYRTGGIPLIKWTLALWKSITWISFMIPRLPADF